MKDRDSLDGEIDQIKEELKNKRVEVALLDQELAKINEEMKIALENLMIVEYVLVEIL